MKIQLLIIALLYSTLSFSQRLYVNSYNHKIDSLIESRSNAAIMHYNYKSRGLIIYKPYRWVKITIKAMANPSKIASDLGANGATDGISSENYLSVAKYDVRVKIYLTKDLRLVNRVLITGANAKKFIYQTGIALKLY